MNRRLALKVFIIDKETSGLVIIKNKSLVHSVLFLIIIKPSVFIYYWKKKHSGTPSHQHYIELWIF